MLVFAGVTSQFFPCLAFSGGAAVKRQKNGYEWTKSVHFEKWGWGVKNVTLFPTDRTTDRPTDRPNERNAFVLFYFILFYFIFCFVLFYFILLYFILLYFILLYFILFYFIYFYFIFFKNFLNFFKKF